MRKRKPPALTGVKRLRWMAAGDLLPDRTPDWVLDHLWPGDLMQRLICRLWGHEVEHPIYCPTSCAWCDATLPEETPDGVVELHTRGLDRHLLVDDQGMEALRRVVPPSEPEPTSRLAEALNPDPAFGGGIPVYINHCPCPEVPT